MAEGIELPISTRFEGFQQATGNMDALLEILKKIGASVDTISSKMDGVGKSTKKAMEEAEKSTESFTDKLGKIGLAVQGVRGIADSIIGTIQPVLEAGISRESQITMLKHLLPTNVDAEQWAKDFRESSFGKIYGDTGMQSATTMMSFGIDEKSAMEFSKAIGNIAGGDANKLQSLSLAFSQMSSTGKLMSQDLMQMIGQGFNPLSIMAEQTGKSVAELKDEMSKGAITAEDVQKAFLEAGNSAKYYGGVTDELSGGTQGGLLAIKNTFDDFMVDLYKALEPLIQTILPKVVTTMQVISAIVSNPIFQAFVAVIASMATAWAVYQSYLKLASAWTVVMTAKQWMLNIAMDANPVGAVIAAITALIALVATIIVYYEKWGATLSMFLGPFGMIINMVMSFKRHWQSIEDAFTKGGMIAGLKRIGAVLLDAMLYPMQQLLNIVSKIPGLTNLASKGMQNIDHLRRSLNLTENEGIIPGKQGDANAGGKRTEGNKVTTTDTTGSATNKGTSAVATGGTRNTSININLGSLVHQISYNGGFKENERQTTADLTGALLRVLNSAASTSGI